MQVFVRRSALATEPVRAAGCLQDSTPITPEILRPDLVVLSLPPSAVVQTAMGGPELKLGWREENRDQILAGETERRILDAFPEHAQRNAAIELGLLATTPQAAWSKRHHERRAEIERAFAYVNAVRQAAKRLKALPPDPTADGHWPARSQAYKAD